MQFHWMDGLADIAEGAARQVCDLLMRKPSAAIALPTGNTPLGLYRALVERGASGRLSCHEARFFNLDEFVGKSSEDADSYGAFLSRHLFAPLAIPGDQIRLLRGDADDLEAECEAFERAIEAAGGLDLAVLGLGGNGHIAFNEPGSDWSARTRPVTLAEETRRAQSGLYPDPADVPRTGLTIGVPTILAAREILLLVSGSGKEEALAALSAGTKDPDRSVTALLDHPNLTVLADRRLRSF